MGQVSLAERGDVLAVTVAGERFGLPAAKVAEIIRPRTMTRVPNAAASLLGLANLRGAVLPVVSFAMLLGLPQSPQSPSSRVVVVDHGAPVGLLFDSVIGLAPTAGAQKIDLEPLLAREYSGVARRDGRARDIAATAPRAASFERDVLVLIGLIVCGREFALPLDAVVEVAPLTAELTDVPHTGPATMGVMAFRGRLLPVVSLRVLLGLPREEFGCRKARVVVVRVGSVVVGLVADTVASVLRVPAEAVDAVPAVLACGAAETQVAAICRLDGGRRLVCILSPDRLFDAETTAALRNGGGQVADPVQQREAQTVVTDQFVVFHLGDERYGLPVSTVRGVVRRPTRLSRVPHAPAFLEGMMSLRGRLVPIINQRERFRVHGSAPSRGHRVVVVEVSGLEAGLAVDAVSELVSVSASHAHTVPLLNDESTGLIDRVAPVGRDGRMILLLDPAVLLNQTERDVLAAMADTARSVVAS